jgi:hypothetical protein
MKVQQNEQSTVIDPYIAERRLAYQKTKQLHKHLDEMKPHSVFTSLTKREAFPREQEQEHKKHAVP